MYFQRYQDISREWRWRLRARNHEIIAVSSEGYVRKTDCTASIHMVMDTDRDTPIRDA